MAILEQVQAMDVKISVSDGLAELEAFLAVGQWLDLLHVEDVHVDAIHEDEHLFILCHQRRMHCVEVLRVTHVWKGILLDSHRLYTIVLKGIKFPDAKKFSATIQDYELSVIHRREVGYNLAVTGHLDV